MLGRLPHGLFLHVVLGIRLAEHQYQVTDKYQKPVAVEHPPNNTRMDAADKHNKRGSPGGVEHPRHISQMDAEDALDEHVNITVSARDVHQRALALPPPGVFQAKWRLQMLLHSTWNPLPSDVQLVVGVFSLESLPHRDFVYQVIKKTWANSPGVCWLSLGQQAGCTVYVAFVLGSRARPSYYQKEELVLNTSENMNLGKSFDYFSHVAAAYPWATHFAKMDLDTFPYLHKLTTSLHQHMTDGCEHYVGRPWFCNQYDRTHHPKICAPLGCGPPVNGSFLTYAREDIDCWSYMQGGLYIMSAGLARGVAAPNSVWSQHKVGIEDVLTGRIVSLYARQKGICITTWNPQAYYHYPY